MRFKGKIDLWFWIVMLVGEALTLSALLDAEDGRIIGYESIKLSEIVEVYRTKEVNKNVQNFDYRR